MDAFEEWETGQFAWTLNHRPNIRRGHDWVRSLWGGGPVYKLMHRRAGKTTGGICDVLVPTYTIPRARCAFIALTKDHVRELVSTRLPFFMDLCPPPLRLVQTKSEYVWRHPGSRAELFLLGADSPHIKTILGHEFDCIVFDEAGHVHESDRIIHEYIGPALLDRRGQLIVQTTVPRIPGHPFQKLWFEAIEARRAWCLRLSENTDPRNWDMAQAIAETGGTDTAAYLREYECQFIYDASTAVIPEATDGKWPPFFSVEVKPSPWSRLSTGLDAGGRDLHASVWGWSWTEPPQRGELPRRKHHICAEYAVRGCTTPELVQGIRNAELGIKGKVSARWADSSNIPLLMDLSRLHQLTYRATDKRDKEAALLSFRADLRNGDLTVSPSCSRLLETMRVARYMPNHKQYARDEVTGHADLLDAALYWHRNAKAALAPAAPGAADVEMMS